MSISEVEIGEAPIEIIDGDRGSNYPKQNELLEDGHCLFLSAKNVTKNGFEFEENQFISEDKDFALRKGKALRHDVIITTRGTLGNVAWYSDSVAFENIRINSGMVLIRPKNQEILPQYLYTFFRSNKFQNQVQALRSGVAQPQLPIRDLKKIKIPLPNRGTQQNLTKTISNYDNLIENNQRRIALLEESARLLYREWFVANQWKDSNSESSTKIRTRPLKEVANLTMGQSPASKFYNEVSEGLPFHQGVTHYGIRFVEDRVYSTQITKIANPGDILLSVRAPVGRINITKNRIVLGRGLAALNSKFGSNSFLFYALKSFFFKEDIIGTGSIYAATTKGQLEKIEIADPPREQIERFENLVSPIDQQIISLWKINQKLTEARDLLLPRLMDGRIAV